MNSNAGSSDYESISQGPSERFERWGQGRRRAVYKKWPPTNAQSYSVWKRYHMHRNMIVDTMGGTSSDDGSDTAPGFDDDFLKARWQELAERKLKVYAIRCQVKREKARIEQIRQARDTADNTFMSILRPIQVHSTSLDAIVSTNILKSQFQHLQTTRDAYQNHELVLVDLERNLMETEDELDLLERRLINDLPHTGTREDSTPHPVNNQVSEQPQSDLLRGLEIEPSTISNPLYQRLLFVLRSIDLARKYRVDLLARRSRLEEQKRLLVTFEKHHPAALRYITPLKDNDLEFLDHFETEERRVSGDIRDRRKEVEHLIRLLWEHNLFPHYTALENVQSWYPDEFSIDVDLGHDHMEAETIRPTDFSILLSNPSHLLEEFPVTAEASLKRAAKVLEGHPQRANAIASAAKEVSIHNLLSDAEDTPNFINRWLLQSLRTSRLEVRALYSSYMSSRDIGVFDIEKWQRDVLHKWWEDEAYMRTLEQFRQVPTSWISATPSPPSWLSEPFLYTWDSDNTDPEFDMTESEQSDGMDGTKSRASGGTKKELGQLTESLTTNELLVALKPKDKDALPLIRV